MLERCQNLQELSLNRNRLTELPGSLELLTQLQKLDVSHNLLAQVPGFLSSMSSLKVQLLTPQLEPPAVSAGALTARLERRRLPSHRMVGHDVVMYTQELDFRDNPLQDFSSLQNFLPHVRLVTTRDQVSP